MYFTKSVFLNTNNNKSLFNWGFAAGEAGSLT